MNDSQSDEDKSLGIRLNEWRKKMGLSQKELAEIVSANQGNVSAALKGKRGVPEKWILTIMKKYVNLNTKWLLNGDGEMLKVPSPDIENQVLLVIDNLEAHQRGNGKQLTKPQMEQLLARQAFRISELEEWKSDMEAWKKEMEDWKAEVLIHLMRKGE